MKWNIFCVMCGWIMNEEVEHFGWCSGGGLLAYGEAVSASEAAATTEEKKKVVVLGTGWAGTSFLRNLNNPRYEVHVVSPRNYFAFTPLLPSVTCGTVEARSVVEPVRNIFRKVIMKNTHFLLPQFFLLFCILWSCPFCLL